MATTQPRAAFKAEDAVSMSVKSGTSQVRKNFKVAARRESLEKNAAKRKWEYQLKDANGVLHADGAWFQEVKDGLCKRG